MFFRSQESSTFKQKKMAEDDNFEDALDNVNGKFNPFLPLFKNL